MHFRLHGMGGAGWGAKYEDIMGDGETTAILENATDVHCQSGYL
jgi:hypothetical protein